MNHILVTLSLLGVARVLAAPRLVPRILDWDDIVVPSDDGASWSVVKKWDYEIEEMKRSARGMDKKLAFPPPHKRWEEERRRKRQVVLSTNESDYPTVGLGPGKLTILPFERPTHRPGHKKHCKHVKEVQVIADVRFTQWDVPTSPVVSNQGAYLCTISVQKGFTITNSVSVTRSTSYQLIEKVLTASFSISWKTDWQTQDAQQLSFFVPSGQIGLIVTQPLTRRIVGNEVTGCEDDQGSLEYSPFSHDSHFDHSYGHMAWVKGPMLLCNSTIYPVPYCRGSGLHK